MYKMKKNVKNSCFTHVIFDKRLSAQLPEAKHGDVEIRQCAEAILNRSCKFYSKRFYEIFFLSICAIIIGNRLPAQTAVGAFLDINNVKAKVNANGSMSWDLVNGRFEVPKGSGKGTIYADALWIGGYDNGSQLRIAAQTYRQTGQDFWPGPLSSAATSDSTISYGMNNVWKLNRCDIQAYHNWVLAGSIGTAPVSAAVQNTITSWPGISPYGLVHRQVDGF